jgi:hypothetical protein
VYFDYKESVYLSYADTKSTKFVIWESKKCVQPHSLTGARKQLRYKVNYEKVVPVYNEWENCYKVFFIMALCNSITQKRKDVVHMVKQDKETSCSKHVSSNCNQNNQSPLWG